MKNLMYVSALCLVASLMLTSSINVNAKGLVGQRSVGLFGGVVKPGDDIVEDIDDSIVSYGLTVNIPVLEKLDLGLSLSRAEIDGDLFGVDYEEEDTAVTGGVRYHFMPGKKINPYVFGAFIYAEADAEVGGISIDDDETGFDAGLGGEIDLTNDASLNLSVAYVDVFDDDVAVSTTLHKWISEHVGLGIELGYAFDSENINYGGILTVGF